MNRRTPFVKNDEALTAAAGVFAFGAAEVDLRANLKVNTESVFPRERVRVRRGKGAGRCISPSPHAPLSSNFTPIVVAVVQLQAPNIHNGSGIRRTDRQHLYRPFIAHSLSLMPGLRGLLRLPLNFGQAELER